MHEVPWPPPGGQGQGQAPYSECVCAEGLKALPRPLPPPTAQNPGAPGISHCMLLHNATQT